MGDDWDTWVCNVVDNDHISALASSGNYRSCALKRSDAGWIAEISYSLIVNGATTIVF